MYDALLESLLVSGERERIVTRQRAELSIAERASGKHSDEMLQALERAAQRYRRIGRYADEADVQQRRIELLRGRYGDSDLRLEPALLDKVKASVSTLKPGPDALRSLKLTNKLVEQNSAASATMKARAKLVYGDFLLTLGNSRRAADYYQKAYRISAAAGGIHPHCPWTNRYRFLYSIRLPRPDPTASRPRPCRAGR